MSVEISRFRKEIIGPYSGQKFQIRRVRLRDCLLELGTLPSVLMEPVAKQLEAFKEKLSGDDPQVAEKVTRFYLTKGVVEPVVWFGETKDQPPESIAFDDLAGDSDYLVNEITQFSFDLKGLREFEEFFRRSVAESAGLDGQEVRPEAVVPGGGA